VTVRYRGDVPVGVEQVLISTQHAEEVDTAQIRDDLWRDVVTSVLPAGFYDPVALREQLLVNPTGGS